MAELDALKQQLQQVAMTGRELILRSQHAATILAALECIPGLEQELAQTWALLRVHKGTSERLAARAERVEAAARKLVGLHPDFGTWTAVDELRAALAAAPALGQVKGDG